jgi:hypothetical protein
VAPVALVPVVALLALAAAEPRKATGGGAAVDADAIDVSRLPPERKAAYELMRRKCASCHSLARAMGTRLTASQWKRHNKRPGVGVSDAQARTVVDFLDFVAARPK